MVKLLLINVLDKYFLDLSLIYQLFYNAAFAQLLIPPHNNNSVGIELGEFDNKNKELVIFLFILSLLIYNVSNFGNFELTMSKSWF